MSLEGLKLLMPAHTCVPEETSTRVCPACSVEQVLKALLAAGIHGWPGGDGECFCLVKVPQPHTLYNGWEEDFEPKYPSDIACPTAKGPPWPPGTLIWVPDYLLKELGLPEPAS